MRERKGRVRVKIKEDEEKNVVGEIKMEKAEVKKKKEYGKGGIEK